MRFLLDTNILIPLEDSKIILKDNLANFIRLATQNGHKLLYHPASKKDIERDTNEIRRQQTINRLSRYQCLEDAPLCPWNLNVRNENELVDNEILYALKSNAVHALITEDRGIHTKARHYGLEKRVYNIQTAEDWLNRLHSQRPISLPNIQEVSLYHLNVSDPFFDSLRVDYGNGDFNSWFLNKSKDGRKAWIYNDHGLTLQAICIYDVQTNEVITDDRKILNGRALKLCTFKVGELVRGRKIGELFLKAAFQYATHNKIENIFITVQPDKQPYLINLLKDFGFIEKGKYKNDMVYVKHHPISQPQNMNITPIEYHRCYFPHYCANHEVQKLIIPIKPCYHKILFPDCHIQNTNQLELFSSDVGNAIKLAYICHAQLSKIEPGDIIMFYRSNDLKAITSIGVVEEFLISSDAEEIARAVSRRTVYRMEEIQRMSNKPTKVILFRLAKHVLEPINYNWLKSNGVVNGNIQTILKISDSAFQKISDYIK